jgi:hypothetical protein
MVAGLLVISSVTYFAQITLFHKSEDTFFYMMQDFAFVPVQVVFVTLVLDRLLKKQEKQSLLKKLNMLIGIFFYEMGTDIITTLKKCTANFNDVSSHLQITPSWTEKEFETRLKFFSSFNYSTSLTPDFLREMKAILIREKESIRDMLKNPNLLEHESFTDLLWALFHLFDELRHRSDMDNLPEPDIKHLEGDLRRVYSLLVVEWLRYMKHLKMEYPYLYSIAVRTNPFNPDAHITVT